MSDLVLLSFDKWCRVISGLSSAKIAAAVSTEEVGKSGISREHGSRVRQIAKAVDRKQSRRCACLNDNNPTDRNGCSDNAVSERGGPIVRGGVWATGVDYTSGHEFRQAGAGLDRACTSNANCDPGEHCDIVCKTSTNVVSHPGMSFQLRSPPGTYNWDREAGGQLWPELGDTAGAHQYVRVPAETLSVLLFVRYTTDGIGYARYSFLDDTSAVPFDE